MQLRERQGKIYIRDFCLEKIADEYGTPFYLYDLNTIKENIANVRKAFGNDIELLYAVKANSNLELLREIRGDLDGLDISSSGEMDQALRAGYTPDQLSFAGPGKTRDELRRAIRQEIGVISVESMRELRDIKTIASEEGRKPNVTLRVNPKLLISEFAIKMGGKSTQFGIDEEALPSAIEYVEAYKNCFHLLGIHVYAGTQCMDENAIVLNITNTIDIAKRLFGTQHLECSFINLGGGFGISYYEEGKQIDLQSVAEPTKKAIREFRASTIEHVRFVIELGRYLVATAGIYVARVISEKRSRGEIYFVLDGGMNHHLAASGNLGAMIIRQNYLVKNLSKPKATRQRCTLVGPLCTPLDLIGKDVVIELPEVGNIVAILNSGSYAFTASPLLFLGHKSPPELLVHDNKITQIRQRKKLSDFN